MPKNILKQTLGDLLAHNDQTIYRNAMSINKRLRKLEQNGTIDEIDSEEIPLQKIAREMDSKEEYDQEQTDLLEKQTANINHMRQATCKHDWDTYGKCTICKAWNY